MYIRYYISFNFHGLGEFKGVKDIEVREYLFSDEEVEKEYEMYEKKLNIEEILGHQKKTLIYTPNLDDIKHKPDIIHLLKGIKLKKDMIFDHDFLMKSC